MSTPTLPVRPWVPWAALAVAAGLIALAPPAPPARAAGLLIADNGFGGVLQIKQHDVRVVLNNGIALTEVEQVFLNTENRPVEALYTFPVPRKATVSNFSMGIGGKEMVGEVVEKQRARQVYDSYKQTRRDPGLLEQVDYKTFEMRIFPIAAGAEQRVRLTYAQELDFDHDTATYVYPLASVASVKGSQKTTGRFSFSLEAKSEVPIVALKSPSHPDGFAVAPRGTYWHAGLETRAGDLGRDVVVVYQVQKPRTGIDVVASRPPGEDGYFLLTLTAGKELEGSAGGSDYVFVLDVSGSMAQDGKLMLSRDSVERFLQVLGQDDRFEVLTFSITVQPLFGEVRPATAETRRQAGEFLWSRRAVGGTLLQPAIEAAYRYRDNDRPLNVVILSDGLTEPREHAELLRAVSRRPGGVTVFCVGVGNEVNRPLLNQLARDSGGMAAFLSQDDDFERQAQAFRRKLTRPAATSVRLTFSGGDVYEVEPGQLPNLYYGQPIRVYGRYRQPGPVQVTWTTQVQGSPVKETVALALPAAETGNPQIERMWALHRVERLMEQDRAAGTKSHVAEIVRLCEGYSIVSEYASFLVLENDAEYQRWQIQRRNATRAARDTAAQQALRRQLDELRQQTAAVLPPAAATTGATTTAVAPAAGTPQAAAAPVSPSGPASPSGDLPPARPWIDRANAPPESSLPGSRGGGAVDPLTVFLSLGLAALAALAQKKRPGTAAPTS